MLSREVVEEGYRTLCAVFGRKGREDQIDAWWEHLRHRVNAEQYMAGIDGVTEHERSFPAVAALLEYCHAYRGRERGTPRVYGRPLPDVLEDIEARRSPLEFSEIPQFWHDQSEMLTYLNAAEETRHIVKPGARLEAMIERLGKKLKPVVQSMPGDDPAESEVPF